MVVYRVVAKQGPQTWHQSQLVSMDIGHNLPGSEYKFCKYLFLHASANSSLPSYGDFFLSEAPDFKKIYQHLCIRNASFELPTALCNNLYWKMLKSTEISHKKTKSMQI